MTMDDFCKHYQEMDICCDSPNFLDGDDACQWNCSLKEGRWEAGKSAGGSDGGAEEFWTNPQYRLTVKEENNGDKNVLLSLLQKPDEEYRSKVKYHAMGFIIYKANKGRLPSSLFQDEQPLKVSEFSGSRELIEFHSLKKGEYLIIPCTVCGSYGDMIAGNPPEAFKDFSGGVHMTCTLSKSPPDLWDVRAVQCKTMMGCGTFDEGLWTDTIPSNPSEAHILLETCRLFSNNNHQVGLMDRDAFTVTGVKQVCCMSCSSS
ncbi:hypothetical protein ABVT39_027212 [Epinephelus coioides]